MKKITFRFFSENITKDVPKPDLKGPETFRRNNLQDMGEKKNTPIVHPSPIPSHSIQVAGDAWKPMARHQRTENTEKGESFFLKSLSTATPKNHHHHIQWYQLGSPRRAGASLNLRSPTSTQLVQESGEGLGKVLTRLALMGSSYF